MQLPFHFVLVEKKKQMLNVNDLIVALLLLTLCPGDTHDGRTRSRQSTSGHISSKYAEHSDLLKPNYSNQNKFMLIYWPPFQRERRRIFLV